ncbi:MAG: acyl-CoA desaturase [Actinobacteria bacterium]|nr:acyl-CoA desaturase [Actinomycetota bacterium]
MTVDAPVSPLEASRREAARGRLAQRTRSFTQLAQSVRDAGLNNRTRWFYLALFAGLVAALGGAVTGLVLLEDSWLQLLIAAALGVIFTQFAFLGHEASHRQVLASGKTNDHFGRILATFFVGMSYAWWMNKHTRHHGNPNKVGKDPDIEPGALAYRDEDVADRGRIASWFTRRQGWFFFPLLLLAGLELHRVSILDLLTRRGVSGRALEITLLAARMVLYLGLLFWLLPFGMAWAFLGVQLAVFGVYMGASFAPNHIGMPIIPADARLDFLDKQVLTSRNIRGGWWMTALMGGLNYQIEHHLFPGMPRPHLRRARVLVLRHCEEQGVPYTETSFPAALGIVARYLNTVGLAAGATFRCPTATRLNSI